MSYEWDDFNKFSWADDRYLPMRGEGNNMATQIVTATTKLVYKWFNDGDVYDNTHLMKGWCNDLSSYANWLYNYAPGADAILDGIVDVESEDDYVDLLYDLCELTNAEEYLAKYEKEKKIDSIYSCDGPFEFREGNV